MAEEALPEMAVEDKQEDTSAVKSSDSQALSVPTSSATVVSHEDEVSPKVPFNPKIQNLINTLSDTFSAALVNLKILLLNVLPSPIQDRFSPIEKKFRQKGNWFFNAPTVNTCLHYLDHFVDTSGFVVRRLQRVVEPDTGCLTTCPYLQHYSNCPLVGKSPPCSSESEDNVEEVLTKESSAEVFTKKDPESEEPKPNSSTLEVNQNSESTVQGVDVTELTATREYVPQGSLAMLFSFAFTWLVLYPVNALVALLNFLRSMTRDLYDYCRLPNTYVTVVGRRIVSPRRAIRSRLMTRMKTMLNEVVNLTAGEHAMPFKLSLDSQISTLRAVPVYETRKTNIKRKFCLADDSLFSGDYLDKDYEPVSSPETSSTDLEDSITVSENDLSPHEEDGFLALKEKPTSKEEGEISESPNPPASFKLEPLET